MMTWMAAAGVCGCVVGLLVAGYTLAGVLASGPPAGPPRGALVMGPPRSPLAVALAALGVVATLAGAGFYGCSHRCTAGHYERASGPGGFESGFVLGVELGVGGIPSDVPAHDAYRWRCECGGFGFAR